MNYKVKVFNTIGSTINDRACYGINIPKNAMRDSCLQEHDIVYVNKHDDGFFISKSAINIADRRHNSNCRIIASVGPGGYRLIIPKTYAEDLNIKVGEVLYITDCEHGSFKLKRLADDQAAFNTNVNILTAAEAHSMMDNYNNSVEELIKKYTDKIGRSIEDSASVGICRATVCISEIYRNEDVVKAIKSILCENGYNYTFCANGWLTIYW